MRLGRRVAVVDLVRIGAVDAVDLGCLEQDVGADLDGAQRGGGVSGEERVPGSRRENHQPALLQVANSASRDERLCHLRHRYRALQPARDAELLDGVAQCQRVDDRREHAHVVGGDAVDAVLRGFLPRTMLPPPTTIAT